MDNATWISVLGTMLLAGLAGSLHCIGMCGPILVGFSRMFAGQPVPVTVNGVAVDDAAAKAGRPRLWLDFVCYHVGRLWTYGMLGLLAGFVGEGIRRGSTEEHWQRGIAIALAVLIILSGIALLGLIPRIRLTQRVADWWGRSGVKRGLDALVQQRGLWPRLLLGAMMGLLPCGLVYAMLPIAAAMPTPAHAMAGMIAFGIGTLPSLSAVLGATRVLERVIDRPWAVHLRAAGTRLAAVLVIAAGGWMLYRALLPRESCCHSALRWTMPGERAGSVSAGWGCRRPVDCGVDQTALAFVDAVRGLRFRLVVEMASTRRAVLVYNAVPTDLPPAA